MLKSLKQHVPLNPPKKKHLQYAPSESTGRDRPTDRTAKTTNSLAGSDRQGCNDGAASAASAIKPLNVAGLVDRVLAPFNENVGGAGT